MKYPPPEISTEPAAAPLTTAEAKVFFREDRSIEDNLIDQFISGARNSTEEHTGYVLIDTVYKQYLKDFYEYKIPKKPFKSGSLSIQYIDDNGATQTLSSDKYTVHEQESPVLVEFLGDLPDLSDEDGDKYPVIITFTAGYGDTSASVPDYWKSVVGMVAMVYWDRKLSPDADFNPFDSGVVRALLQNKKIGRFK